MGDLKPGFEISIGKSSRGIVHYVLILNKKIDPLHSTQVVFYNLHRSIRYMERTLNNLYEKS